MKASDRGRKSKVNKFLVVSMKFLLVVAQMFLAICENKDLLKFCKNNQALKYKTPKF